MKTLYSESPDMFNSEQVNLFDNMTNARIGSIIKESERRYRAERSGIPTAFFSHESIAKSYLASKFYNWKTIQKSKNFNQLKLF